MKFWKWYKIMIAVGFGLLFILLGLMYIGQDGGKQSTLSPAQSQQQAPAKKSPFVTN
jgi:hypothetical protein